MGILTKEQLLGATDLREEEVDLPELEGSVRIRSLAAAFSNDAQSEALEVVTDTKTGRQTARVNTRKLEELQVLHGLVEPKLSSIQEAHQLAERIGPSWRRIVDRIDEISGVNKEAIEQANVAFRPGGPEETGVSGVNGSASDDSRSDLDVSAGV